MRNDNELPVGEKRTTTYWENGVKLDPPRVVIEDITPEDVEDFSFLEPQPVMAKKQ